MRGSGLSRSEPSALVTPLKRHPTMTPGLCHADSSNSVPGSTSRFARARNRNDLTRGQEGEWHEMPDDVWRRLTRQDGSLCMSGVGRIHPAAINGFVNLKGMSGEREQQPLARAPVSHTTLAQNGLMLGRQPLTPTFVWGRSTTSCRKRVLLHAVPPLLPRAASGSVWAHHSGWPPLR